MTTMISEVYDALKDANGVSDEKARKAAEAVAQFDTRFNELNARLNELKTSVDARANQTDLRIEALSGRVNLVQWQLIAVLGGVASLLLKAFF
jgi:hypothetical protein